MASKAVLVYGGRGALGSSIAALFKSSGYRLGFGDKFEVEYSRTFKIFLFNLHLELSLLTSMRNTRTMMVGCLKSFSLSLTNVPQIS